MRARPSAADRLLLVVVPALAWATSYHPGIEWRRLVRDLAGHPARQGPWLVAEHLLVQTTVPAVAALLAWGWLARRGLLAPVRDSFALHDRRRTIGLGVASGAGIAVFVLGVLWASGAPLHAPRVDGWDVLGNVASNLYEEIVFRGLLLLALLAATGRAGVAVIASSALFAAVHTQYPMGFRAMIFLTTAVVSWARLRTGSLWTAWVAHQLSDMLVDPFLA